MWHYQEKNAECQRRIHSLSPHLVFWCPVLLKKKPWRPRRGREERCCLPGRRPAGCPPSRQGTVSGPTTGYTPDTRLFLPLSPPGRRQCPGDTAPWPLPEGNACNEGRLQCAVSAVRQRRTARTSDPLRPLAALSLSSLRPGSAPIGQTLVFLLR